MSDDILTPETEGLLKRCPGYVANFKTMCKAFENGDIALMACKEKATGKDVAVVCAVSQDMEDGKPMYTFIPLARLFDGNPYEELIPPDK